MKPEYERLCRRAETSEDAIKRLIDVIEVLRKECPWDKVQTHESLKVCLIEEAYEVIDAIDKNDTANLREELGDVLLQVVFHASIKSEEGQFDMCDIINEECEKMIRRHPHVFSEESIKSIDKVLEKWENIKGRETGKTDQTSKMTKIPKALPALMRANKVQKKAADVGFDWDDVLPAFDKIAEEAAELKEAYKEKDKNAITEELGDLIFSVVNVARFLDVNPEEALNFTTNKFIKRFSYIENEALACGKRLEDMSLAEMDELWEQAKHK